MESGNRRGAKSAQAGSGGSVIAIAIVLSVLGFILGATFDDDLWAACSGAGIGWLTAVWIGAKRRGTALERHMAGLLARVDDLERRLRSASPAAPLEAPPATDDAVAEDARASRAQPTASAASAAASAAPPAAAPRRSSPSAARTARAPRPNPLAPAFQMAREFLFGGNTVVRVGILVLLVGVGLLAKWASDNALLPIEARLAGGAGIGLALTALGVRLREQRPGFATTLQGGGIASLYVVVFCAFRIFELIPAGMAFGLSVVIAAAAAVLAVTQRSQPLIFIGTAGGFAAPLLASTGEGNHVVLFTYYLILNSGVASVAWFRSWRALNLLAFVSTYGVATVWGVLRYDPEQLASTEFFVIAFLLLFTFEALFFSWRRPPQLRGVVDGTLVFGTPLVTLIAQAHLVRDIEFGLAYSAAGLALFYALVATWLWRTAPETLRRMTEAFVALAVGFATMAIPFAFEGSMTTAVAWSLEGAGIYWIGSRQSRRLARLSGVALQALSAIAFLVSALGFGRASDPTVAIVNGPYLSTLALAVSGFFIAREAHVYATVSRREAGLTQLLGAWGLLWWLIGLTREVESFAPWEFRYALLLVLLGATGVALEWLGARTSWRPGRVLGLAILPLGFLMIPVGLDHPSQLLENATLLAWPLLLVCVYRVLGRLEEMRGHAEASGGEAPGEETGRGDGQLDRWLPYAYAPALWLLGLVTSIGLGMIVEERIDLGESWSTAAIGFGLAAVIFAFSEAGRRAGSAFARHRAVQFSLGVGPLAALLLLFTLVANLGSDGGATQIPYLPLLNPIDVVLALAYATLGVAFVRGRQHVDWLASRDAARALAAVSAAAGFLWLNGILARSVHHWAGVPFDAADLWESTPLQVCFSISWTLLALAGMWTSTRRGWRVPWIVSASLVGIVVVKLFVVDLSQLGTGTKIVTFLVVGALLLVVGYVSPVPPDSPRRGADGGADDSSDSALPPSPASSIASSTGGS